MVLVALYLMIFHSKPLMMLCVGVGWGATTSFPIDLTVPLTI